MKLIKYLKPYLKYAVLAPVAMIGEVMADLWQPKLMSAIIDKGVIGGDMNFIIRTGIIMFILVIAGGICGIASAAFSGTAAQSFGYDLRNDTFKKIMSLSVEQTDKFTSGSLITRLTNDISSVQQFVDLILRMFIRMIMFFGGGIIMMLTLDISFGVILLCSLPAMLIAMGIAFARALPIYGKIQQKLDAVNNIVKENIGGTRVVKAFVQEEAEESKFADANDDLSGTNLYVLRIMAALNPILMIVMNISVAAVILIGGFRIETAKINVGDVMAAVTYITLIMISVTMFSMMFQSVSRARASAVRINEVLETVPVIEDGDNDKAKLVKRGSVSFRGVNFTYPGASGLPVLSGISIEIKAGETFALLGSTGAGKTALVNLIPRFYDVSEGEIIVDGIPVKDYPVADLRGKIGMVLQKSELFSGTVSDNIKWGNPGASDEDVIRAAKIAQADEFISKMPDGYNSFIAEKGTSLSGGQKQRICIARAIIRKPEIIILDDCTSALDLETETLLQNALRNELKGTTVIKIAQRIASVKNADRIAVIDLGIISAVGTHDELMINSQVYRDIYDSQHGGNTKSQKRSGFSYGGQ